MGCRVARLWGMSKRGLSIVFSQVLKKHRLAQKLSQEALAEMADVHPTYIGLLERGLRTPSIDVADRLSKALGKSLSELIAEAEKGIKEK